MDSPTIVTIIQVAGEPARRFAELEGNPVPGGTGGVRRTCAGIPKHTMPVGILSNARKADAGLSDKAANEALSCGSP